MCSSSIWCLAVAMNIRYIYYLKGHTEFTTNCGAFGFSYFTFSMESTL